jgi:hypothetical protein
VKCKKSGCAGKLDIKNIKYLSATKVIAKCKKCGKEHKLSRIAKTPYNKARYKG